MSYTTGLNFTVPNEYTTGLNFAFVSDNISAVSSGTLGLIGSTLEVPITVEDNYSQVAAGIVGLIGQTLTIYAPEHNTSTLSTATLPLIGDTPHSVSTNLLSFDNYTITIQGTRDWYYLSDDLDSFDVDYYPYYLSDIPRDLIQTATTSNVPVDSTTYSISAGVFDKSYLYDFYFRIHIDPSVVDLGTITTAETYTVHVWNSYFVSQNVTSITPSSLPDTNLNFPYSVPYTFTPLQDLTLNINVAEFGEPVIDGSFIFNFAIGEYSLGVSGVRALLWPYLPDINYSESRLYLTDVIASRTQEQRFVAREIPRINLKYNYHFRGREDFANARELAKTLANYGIAMPFWNDVVKLNNLTVGDTIVYIDTTYLEYAVNSLMLFYVSPEVYEVRIILEVYSDRVVLTKGLNRSYTSCWTAPVYVGYLNNGISYSEGEHYGKEINIDFTGAEAFFDATEYTPNLYYKTLPVLTLPSVVTGGLNGGYTREQDTFDSITGLYSNIDSELYTRMSYAMRINSVTKESAYITRRFYDWLQGKYQAFWLPSYHNDILAAGTILTGQNSLVIEEETWPIHEPKYVRVHSNNGNSQIFEVSSISTNGDGTATMLFVENATTDLNSIFMIEVVTKVRLNTDTVEYQHPDRTLTSVATAVIEVPS